MGSMPMQPNVPVVSVSDLPDDAVMVDVRERNEWRAGHAPDAVLIPMGDLPSQIEELPLGDGPLAVVCRSGNRSGRVVAWLSQQGIDANFVHPEQGWLIWECGYSVGAHAPDPENAYGLLNWYTSAKPQAYYAKSYTYVISDQKTLPLLNDKLVNAIGLEDPTSAFQGGIPLQIPENYPDWISTYHDIKAGMS